MTALMIVVVVIIPHVNKPVVTQYFFICSWSVYHAVYLGYFCIGIVEDQECLTLCKNSHH